MPKQSGRWVITAEHFARDRADLNKIRSALVLDHNAELEKAAERFREELEEFDRQYDRIDQLEAMAERYASTKLGRRKIAEVGRPKPAKPRRPTPSRPVPSGPRWTPEEDERLLSDDEAQIDKLAVERGVNRSAIEKHLSVLRRRQLNRVDAHPAPATVETPIQTEMSSSETADIFEPTAEAIAKAEPVIPEPTPEVKPSTEASRPDDGRFSPTLQEKLHGYPPERHPQRHPAIKDEGGFIKAPTRERLMGGR